MAARPPFSTAQSQFLTPNILRFAGRLSVADMVTWSPFEHVTGGALPPNNTKACCVEPLHQSEECKSTPAPEWEQVISLLFISDFLHFCVLSPGLSIVLASHISHIDTCISIYIALIFISLFFILFLPPPFPPLSTAHEHIVQTPRPKPPTPPLQEFSMSHSYGLVEQEGRFRASTHLQRFEGWALLLLLSIHRRDPDGRASFLGRCAVEVQTPSPSIRLVHPELAHPLVCRALRLREAASSTPRPLCRESLNLEPPTPHPRSRCRPKSWATNTTTLNSKPETET